MPFSNEKLSSKRQTIITLLALAMLSFCLYANTLDNGFVLDDTAYIRDNYLLHDISNFPKFFNVPPDGVVEDLAPGFLRGRNIRWATFAIDYVLGKGSPLVFHLSNIFWHFLTGTALFFLFRRFLGNAGIAFAGAVLFLAHPIQTNAVAYIFGRKDILAACFVILSFVAVFRFRESGKSSWLLLGGGSFFVAYFSKEMAAIFPLLLLWSDLCLDRANNFSRALVANLRRHWKEYLLFFSLLSLFVWHQFGADIFTRFLGAGDPEGIPSQLSSGATRQANLSFANLMFFYLWKLLFPVDLLADYRGVFHFSLYPAEWGLVCSLVFVVFLVCFLIWLRPRWPEGALGLGWVVIALLPVSHIIDFHYPVAEHYLYLPCTGYVLVLASIISFLHKRVGRYALTAFCLLLLLYGVSTIRRNMDWQNMETLTMDILEKAPDHLGARGTLVHLYKQKGLYAKAIAQGEFIIQQAPDSAINHYNLGVLYDDSGDVAKAAFHYRRAIALKKTMWNAYLNLGNLLLTSGNEKAGYEVINQLISLYAYEPLAYWVLGTHHARKGDWESALSFFRRELEIDPAEPTGHLGVAGSLWNTGEQKEAEKELTMALEEGLDLGWAKKQEPWTAFFDRSDVQVFLKKANINY